MKRYLAEAIGTYGLVFFGTGAVVVNTVSDGLVGLTGIAAAFGLIVAAMIYAIGDISGAHINPAVTLAVAITKRMPAKEVAPYLIAQCAGAIAASGTLLALFPGLDSYGPTLPLPEAAINPVVQSLVMEIVLTFFLMFTILGVTASGKAEGPLAGFVIGGVVAFEVFVGGPISGGSMNPARSLGPALVGGQMQHFWLYVVGPIVGAVLAALVMDFLRSGMEEAEEA